MAKQMMPRRGSVRFGNVRKGSPSPSPRPSTGSRSGSNAGRFTSRPNGAKTQPRPSRSGSGSRGGTGGAFGSNPGRAGKAFTNPRGSGPRPSVRFGK